MVDLRELEMRDLEGRVAQATAALSGRQDKNKDAELELLRLQDENKKLIDENKLMKNWLQTLIRLIEQHDEDSPISQADVDQLSGGAGGAADAPPASQPPSAPEAANPPPVQAAVPADPPSPPMPPDVPAGEPPAAAPAATPEALPVSDPAPAATAQAPAPEAPDANLVASMRSQHQVDYNEVLENEGESKSLLGKIKMRLNGPGAQNG